MSAIKEAVTWFCPIVLGFLSSLLLNILVFDYQLYPDQPVLTITGNFVFFEATSSPPLYDDDILPLTGLEDYDPEDYQLQRVRTDVFPSSPRWTPNRPQFLADELHLIPRKALVAVVAKSLESLSKARFVSEVLSSEPDVKTVIFVSAKDADIKPSIPNLVVFDSQTMECFLLKILKYVTSNIQLKEFQMLYIMPDDLYVNPYRFREFLAQFTANDDIYVGQPLSGRANDMCSLRSGIGLSYSATIDLKQELVACQIDCDQFMDFSWSDRESVALGDCLKRSSRRPWPCKMYGDILVVQPGVDTLEAMQALHQDNLSLELIAAQTRTEQIQLEIRDVEDMLAKGDYSWPLGSNSITRPPQKHMNEEWVTFNATHYFPPDFEVPALGLPSLLASDLHHVLQVVKPKAGLEDVNQGWMHLDPNRGIDYLLSIGETPQFYRAVRELNAIPTTVQIPSKQESGVINIVLPVQSQPDVIYFLQKFLEYQERRNYTSYMCKQY